MSLNVGKAVVTTCVLCVPRCVYLGCLFCIQEAFEYDEVAKTVRCTIAAYAGSSILQDSAVADVFSIEVVVWTN